MYKVKTSFGENIACMGIVIPGNITQILTLGFNVNDELLCFSNNYISLSSKNPQELLASGIIGSSQTGADYGSAMEVVRQHELSLHARKKGMPITYTVHDINNTNIQLLESFMGQVNPKLQLEIESSIKHREATRLAWENLYTKKTYGYENNIRLYLPTEEKIVPQAELSQREHGFFIELKKSGEERS